MSKNILILSGSPRKGGNSDILCDRFMEGARESGHRAEKVFLRDKNIGYCIGCEACHQNNGVDPGGKACFGGFLGAMVQLLPEDRPCV